MVSPPEEAPPSSARRTTIPACPASIAPERVTIPPSSPLPPRDDAADIQELSFALQSALSRLGVLARHAEETAQLERSRLLYMVGMVREALDMAMHLSRRVRERHEGAQP